MSRQKTYSFTTAVEYKLKAFRNYLIHQGLSPATINQKSNYAGYYLSWLINENISIYQVTYKDLLSFTEHQMEKGRSKRHIATMIRAIQNYYHYLQTLDPQLINPAHNLKIHGIKDHLPQGITDYKKLEAIYSHYPAKDIRGKRNKLILGLLIYQGLSSGELQRLTLRDIDLNKGQIYVQGTRKRNSRHLKLQPFQILQLKDYMDKTRKRILRSANKNNNSKQSNNQLILSTTGNINIKNTLCHLFREIQKTSPGLQNAKQIRSSLITHWLKHHNLRQVQYMAGHKYVSSTERYNMDKLESLKAKLEKCHPLNDIP